MINFVSAPTSTHSKVSSNKVDSKKQLESVYNFDGKHILIIIENLPAPFDRRVWQEASSLKAAGATVSIICPKMKGYDKSYERINGIEIYRHPLPLEGKGLFGYLLEYSTAIFWELFLAIKIYSKNKFHVIHGCNPPDLIFLTALPFKLFGVKYVFDHHDINPELFLAKFNKKNILYKAMLILEKITFKVADYVISTNDSYKEIAMRRGNVDLSKLAVIRSGPNVDKFKITNGDNAYKKGRKYLVGYLGVIGEQEGLDLLLESIQFITQLRTDIHFAIVGGGTYLEKAKEIATHKSLNSYVDFYGRVDDRLMLDILNSCDICVNPDKANEMNNLSTMNKIMEYMALGKAIVQYDLKEGKYSAQSASLYAIPNDTTDFANKIMQLIDDDSLRDTMAEFGFHRVRNDLSWNLEEKKFLSFYKKILSKVNIS